MSINLKILEIGYKKWTSYFTNILDKQINILSLNDKYGDTSIWLLNNIATHSKSKLYYNNINDYEKIKTKFLKTSEENKIIFYNKSDNYILNYYKNKKKINIFDILLIYLIFLHSLLYYHY